MGMQGIAKRWYTVDNNGGAIMINVDTIDIEELEKELKTYAKKAFPFATKTTLNNAAFKARELIQKDIRVKMVTRNQFTERSILVDQSKTLNVRRQSATVGSTADYMKTQEFGGTKRAGGSEGVPIPTSYSAGQGEQQQPRTKLPRKPNNIRNIRLRGKTRKARNRKQALLFKMQDAVTSGKRFIFYDFGSGKKKGIFRVVGGSRKFKRGMPRGARLRMVYDLTEKIVDIPKTPMFKPVVATTQVLIPAMYRKAVEFQVRRFGLFK